MSRSALVSIVAIAFVVAACSSSSSKSSSDGGAAGKGGQGGAGAAGGAAAGSSAGAGSIGSGGGSGGTAGASGGASGTTGGAGGAAGGSAGGAGHGAGGGAGADGGAAASGGAGADGGAQPTSCNPRCAVGQLCVFPSCGEQCVALGPTGAACGPGQMMCVPAKGGTGCQVPLRCSSPAPFCIDRPTGCTQCNCLPANVCQGHGQCTNVYVGIDADSTYVVCDG
jgi:hypothetical protein